MTGIILSKRENYNDYMCQYMKSRYKNRRDKVLQLLGGCCTLCGSVDNLELDHVDPSTKYKTIAQLSSASSEVWEAEVSKCQILCRSCHVEKSRKEGSFSNRAVLRVCACGRVCNSNREYSGHRRWCRL